MRCNKHNKIMILQTGKYHMYCPECDAEAVAEAHKLFPVESGYCTEIKTHICERCHIQFKVKTRRKKYCPPCLLKQKQEGYEKRNRRRREAIIHKK